MKMGLNKFSEYISNIGVLNMSFISSLSLMEIENNKCIRLTLKIRENLL